MKTLFPGKFGSGVDETLGGATMARMERGGGWSSLSARKRRGAPGRKKRERNSGRSRGASGSRKESAYQPTCGSSVRATRDAVARKSAEVAWRGRRQPASAGAARRGQPAQDARSGLGGNVVAVQGTQYYSMMHEAGTGSEVHVRMVTGMSRPRLFAGTSPSSSISHRVVIWSTYHLARP